MPRPRKLVPSYSLHKPSGQAVVKFTGPDGKRHTVYLGPHGSDASRQEYERLLVTLRTTTPASTASPALLRVPADLTVNEALAAYVGHVKGYYPPGSARGHLDALRAVRRIAGHLLLREFTPRVFKAVRQVMIDAKQSRTTINGRCQKIAMFVKWCVAEELAGPDVHAALRAVPGLRKGRGEAKELPPARPPAESELLKVVGVLPPAAAALVRVQSVCGARAGELVRLRGDQLDRSGSVWKAVVGEHKGEWRGKERTLYFGPRVQEVLAPLVLKAGGGFLFVNGRGRTFNTQGYRQSVKRGCRRAGVPEFGTHAIRKFAATRIRSLVDVEVARVLLGHSDMGLTAEVYAQLDERKITDAMGRVG